jgi:hypothetical protein
MQKILLLSLPQIFYKFLLERGEYKMIPAEFSRISVSEIKLPCGHSIFHMRFFQEVALCRQLRGSIVRTKMSCQEKVFCCFVRKTKAS